MNDPQHKTPPAAARARTAPTPRHDREELLRTLKFELLSSGITLDETQGGFDPYNSQSSPTHREIWEAIRRRR